MSKKPRIYETDLAVVTGLKLEDCVDQEEHGQPVPIDRKKKSKPAKRDSVLRLIARIKKV